MATAALITAVVGTTYSIKKGEEASRERRKAAKVTRRQAEIRNARSRRKAAAGAVRARSGATAEAAATGTIGSSAVSGALASIQAQAAERIGFSKVQTAGGQEVAGFEAAAARAETSASTAGAVAALPGQVGLQPSFAPTGNTLPPVLPATTTVIT